MYFSVKIVYYKNYLIYFKNEFVYIKSNKKLFIILLGNTYSNYSIKIKNWKYSILKIIN